MKPPNSFLFRCLSILLLTGALHAARGNVHENLSLSIIIQDNHITGDTEFCKELLNDTPITGTRLNHIDGGSMSVQSEAAFTWAAITIEWQWSFSGLPGTFHGIENLPEEIIVSKENAASSPYNIGSIDAIVTGYYDLIIKSGLTQSIYFRRLITVVMDDVSSFGAAPSSSVFIKSIGLHDVCDDNEISLSPETSGKFCNEDVPACIHIQGNDMSKDLCTAEYQWYYMTEKNQVWMPITGATGKDHMACVTETTQFTRETKYQDLPDEFQCLSNPLSVIVYPHPEKVAILSSG